MAKKAFILAFALTSGYIAAHIVVEIAVRLINYII